MQMTASVSVFAHQYYNHRLCEKMDFINVLLRLRGTAKAVINMWTGAYIRIISVLNP